MKKLHVRVEYEEAIESRKQFLESQLNILEILKRLKKYKLLRKRELILKTKLKQSFSSLHSEINQLQNHLPKSESEGKLRIKKIKAKQETEKDKNLESQLQEIREKLARLQ